MGTKPTKTEAAEAGAAEPAETLVTRTAEDRSDKSIKTEAAEAAAAEPDETLVTRTAEDRSDKSIKRLWSSISVGDKQQALITFVATLAANITTVIFIALAIVAYHASNIINSFYSPQRGRPSHTWIGWISFAASIIFFASIFSKPAKKAWPALSWLGPAIIIICVLLIFFACLGELASIKQ